MTQRQKISGSRARVFRIGVAKRYPMVCRDCMASACDSTTYRATILPVAQTTLPIKSSQGIWQLKFLRPTPLRINLELFRVSPAIGALPFEDFFVMEDMVLVILRS